MAKIKWSKKRCHVTSHSLDSRPRPLLLPEQDTTKTKIYAELIFPIVTSCEKGLSGEEINNKCGRTIFNCS